MSVELRAFFILRKTASVCSNVPWPMISTSAVQCEECYGSTVLELDDLIATKMVHVSDGKGKRLWRCLECSRERYSKTEISRHVEATHIQHPGYQCQHCDVISKTRDSLRHHVKNHHQ